MPTKLDAANGQMDDGNYFLHEHPRGARSWQEECVQDSLWWTGVHWIRNDQCETGMVVLVDGAEYPARKCAGWMIM